MIHLLDTNVISELVRPRPSTKVRQWVGARTEFAISVVTVEEIVFGIERAPAPRRRKLVAWFDDLLGALHQVHDVTPPIARAAGELRAARMRAGRRVAQADMFIAATAVVHGLTLATRNVADFEDCGLVLVDPFS
jgi:predicted nucleic acid-binding protein